MAFAFDGCTTLTTITIPWSVTNIGYDAFYDCTGVTNVTIPGNIAELGGVFNACRKLTTVTFANGVTSIVGYAFYDCSTLTSVTIPPSVTNIGDSAFEECTSLRSLIIPGSVTSIGQEAFEVCTSLTNITIPSSVTSIGEAAFARCTSLTSVTIPASVTNLGDWAFVSCTSLTAITVDPLNSCYSSAAGVLFDKAQMTIIQYPAGKAGAYSISNSVTSIGQEAFEVCTSLTSVSIPGSVTNLGDWAFDYCTGLTNVYFTGNAPTADSTVFNSDTNATVCYYLGYTGWNSTFAGLPAVPLNPFALTTNAAATTIAAYTGPGGAITIPPTINGLPVTSIGADAFASNTTLTSVTIPTSVTSISNYAFYGCTGLTNMAIPASVTSIGCSAFAQTSLAGVYFQGNAPTVCSTAFGDPPTIYYLPGTTGWDVFAANTGLTPVLWNPGIPTDDGVFGAQTNYFGFNITNAANLTVVVEACTNLVNPIWVPLTTNTLVNGLFYFSEPVEGNSSGWFYGLGLP